MITYTDIHYLVGLLSKVAHHEDDIDIEFGSQIYDPLGEINRDVDVTVRFVDPDGNTTIFKGIEVKHHKKRPLNIEQVEQLCRKLHDVEGVTHRAIVSSSGYSKAAITKGQKLGVDLYEIIDAGAIDFSHVKIPATVNLRQRSVSYNDRWTIEIVPEKGYVNPIKNSTQPVIFYLNGREMPTIRSADALGKYIINSFDTNQLGEFEGSKSITISEPIDNLTVRVMGRLYKIKEIRVHCTVNVSFSKLEPTFKIMRKVGEKDPFVGCLISEFSNGNLMGLALASDSRAVSLISIPLSDRLKKKIKEQKLLTFDE